MRASRRPGGKGSPLQGEKLRPAPTEEVLPGAFVEEQVSLLSWLLPLSRDSSPKTEFVEREGTPSPVSFLGQARGQCQPWGLLTRGPRAASDIPSLGPHSASPAWGPSCLDILELSFAA